MKKLYISLILALVSLSLFAQPEARLLRFPSVGGDKIAFTYAGDLYTVSVDGGIAKKITTDVGYEVFSRFSPDGKTIAFTGQYDGNTEVYTIPAEGGVPKRLSYTAALDRDLIGDRMGPNNIIMCWTPDGKNIVFRSRWYSFSASRGALFKIPVEGGTISQIPLTEGGFCSFSPDGSQLALNRMFREFRTWKYYTGGQADDIWVNKVGTTKLENITNNPSQNIFPMWVGSDIYFVSDRDLTMNLFRYDTQTKQTTKVTDFTDFDIKFPSYSQEYIVFENGGYIYKYSVKDNKTEKVNIQLIDENNYSRSQLVDASGRMSNYSLSPDGERVLITARGEIFSVPASKGATYNLTLTPGAHEREAEWSPDGKHIVYFSDEDGEYQVYMKSTEPNATPVKMTNFKDGYPAGLSWSPDSKKIFFTTEKREFYSIDIASKKVKMLYQAPFSGIRGYDVSPDSRWVTFTTQAENKMSVIYIMDIEQGNPIPVTTKWYSSSSPLFSEDGKYLLFSSARDFNAIYSRTEWNAAYSINNQVFILPLAKNTPNPTALKTNEYTPKAETPAAKVDNNKNSKKSTPATIPAEKPAVSVKIDFDNIIERATALPLPAGFYQLISVIDNTLYYSDRQEIFRLPFNTMKSQSITKARLITYSPSSKKALMRQGRDLHVVTFGPNIKLDDKVPTNDMKVKVDYAKEWNQIFNESWRIYRDHFYVENMHGADWAGLRKKYSALIPYVNHRHDLTYVIGEMISELNIGHAYVTSGDAPNPEKIKTGLLGGRFSKDKSGFYKIEKIYKRTSWDSKIKSPLDQPGVDVKVGEYIVAINNVPANEYVDIYEALIGKVGTIVALSVNSTPSIKGVRTVYVEPIADESQLAYYEWVQTNIEKVDKASNGQIGYIHIPDMGVAGLDEFTKMFYTQLEKKALIIDDRMNGGGNVSPMILERLNREVFRISMSRNGSNQPVPNETHVGPKVCLVDKYSMSDGDLFPQGFQQLGIGKVIGTRTWGGIVGISGSKQFLDGQDMRTPFFTQYDVNGEWMLEGIGVIPDIEVDINPFEDFKGNDAQLTKAIEVLLEELKDYKPLPSTPADPIRVRK